MVTDSFMADRSAQLMADPLPGQDACTCDWPISYDADCPVHGFGSLDEEAELEAHDMDCYGSLQ